MRYRDLFVSSFRWRQTHLALLVGLVLLSLPSAAQAQTVLPALFAVVDVASDDVLNVRAAPSASADIVATLQPDAAGVEVVRLAETGRWGQVNAGEGAGWVSMRFLSPEPATGGRGELPEVLSCYGTEPFWGLGWQDGALSFSTPEDDAPRSLRLDEVLASMTLPAPHWIVTGDLGERRMTAVIDSQLCNDGMSNRQFGLAITLVDDAPDGGRAYSGCCSLER